MSAKHHSLTAQNMHIRSVCVSLRLLNAADECSARKRHVASMHAHCKLSTFSWMMMMTLRVSGDDDEAGGDIVDLMLLLRLHVASCEQSFSYHLVNNPSMH